MKLFHARDNGMLQNFGIYVRPPSGWKYKTIFLLYDMPNKFIKRFREPSTSLSIFEYIVFLFQLGVVVVVK